MEREIRELIEKYRTSFRAYVPHSAYQTKDEDAYDFAKRDTYHEIILDLKNLLRECNEDK